MKEINKKHVYTFIIICMPILFYLFFAFYDGVVICVDSPTYIDMSISREPFYPMILAMLRAIFPDDYLFITVVLQSVLAGIAASVIPLYLRRIKKLSFLLTVLLTLIPMMTSVLCRFAAKRASMYSNSILTEGIACSVFLIFIRYLLEYCYCKTTKSLIISAGVCFLLISTRKQMYFTLVLLLIGILYTGIRKHQIKKGCILIVLCCSLIILANKGFDNIYGYVVHGTMHGHSSDNRFLATVAFYASERENGENISDTEAQQLFYEIYDSCEEQNYLGHSAGKEWRQRAAHFGDSYDRIQIDTMWPAIEKYVSDHYPSDDVGREKMVDSFTDRIIRGLLPDVWPRILRIFADNMCVGLITTVAKVHPVLIGYTFVVYAVYIAMLIYLGIHDCKSMAFLYGCLTVISIFLNVALVSVVIFCQTRYTIYNMPLFYMSFILMARECYMIIRGKQTIENT